MGLLNVTKSHAYETQEHARVSILEKHETAPWVLSGNHGLAAN